MNEVDRPANQINYLQGNHKINWQFNCPVHEPSGKYFSESDRYNNLL